MREDLEIVEEGHYHSGGECSIVALDAWNITINSIVAQYLKKMFLLKIFNTIKYNCKLSKMVQIWQYQFVGEVN